MNIENIKSLAEILSAYGLTSLEISEGETKIRIEKDAASQFIRQSYATQVTPPLEEVTEDGGQAVDFNRLIEVTSPLVGVFYSAPSPESETFVSIGSKVKKGDVLCVIETMKLMNEIVAEQDGEIVDICLKNGDIVEFGQILFKMY